MLATMDEARRQVEAFGDRARSGGAVALSRLADVVASNALGRAPSPQLFPADSAPLNHARYLFLDPRSQIFYADWEKSARTR